MRHGGRRWSVARGATPAVRSLGAAIPGWPAGSQRTVLYSLGAEDFAIALAAACAIKPPKSPKLQKPKCPKSPVVLTA